MCITKQSKGPKAASVVMKEIVTDAVLQEHSFRGIKRMDHVNIRFDKYTHFLSAVYQMFIYAKDVLKRFKEEELPASIDIEAKISEYIRHAKERIIKKAAKDNASS